MFKRTFFFCFCFFELRVTGFLDSCAFTSTPEIIRAGHKDGLRRWIMGQRDRPVLVKPQPGISEEQCGRGDGWKSSHVST